MGAEAFDLPCDCFHIIDYGDKTVVKVGSLMRKFSYFYGDYLAILTSRISTEMLGVEDTAKSGIHQNYVRGI